MLGAFFLMNRMKVRFCRFQMKDDHFFFRGGGELLKLKFPESWTK